MKHLILSNKDQLKQLLYCGFHIGLKDDKFKSFGGFQRWWYNKAQDACFSCESHWIDNKKHFKCTTLKKASKFLWTHRDRLYVYTRGLDNKKILQLERYFLHSQR